MTQSFWWSSAKVRPVWVEITRRPNDDIGIDLNHNTSSPHQYRLLAEPRPGDRVLHWDSKRGAFVGASEVKRRHLDSGNDRSVELRNFQGLPNKSLTLEMIQKHGQEIGRIRDRLAAGMGALHFPFNPYGSSGWKRTRPALSYLSAAPAPLVALLGGIYEAGRQGNHSMPEWSDFGLGNVRRVPNSNSGVTASFLHYLEANEDITVNPQNEARLRNDKALQASYRLHNAIQNKLARWLESKGVVPESQRAMDTYPVDIQWRIGNRLFVGEVKSISKSNEISQLRRGLGQILHYKYLAAMQHPRFTVVPVLVVSGPPSKRDDWDSVCHDAGVILTWPPAFRGQLLR